MANDSTFPAQEKGVTLPEKGTSVVPFKSGDFPLLLLSQVQPVAKWEFNIIAGVSKATSTKYGGLTKTRELISQQMQIVNNRFNQSVFNQPVFKQPIFFKVTSTSVYEFAGNVQNALADPPPGYSYRIVYDGITGAQGGWLGDVMQVIYHSWRFDYLGGTFGSQATDGLVHEFGHARGAIDLYALEVDAANNPINHQDFRAVASIMNHPYGVQTWDEHSVNLINKNANTLVQSTKYITTEFPPSFVVRTMNMQGKRLPNIHIKLYPVVFKQPYSHAVDATPVFSSKTNAQGELVLPQNPFDPGKKGFDYDIHYCNFLISAGNGTNAVFQWMPLNHVQNYHFTNPTQPYIVTIVM